MLPTRNMKVTSIYLFTCIFTESLNFNFINALVAPFIDLPPDTPMLDLSKIAGMDLAKLPGVEQSGERCIRNIQEWLLHEVSSEETAVLPEDKLQRIMVGVCIFLFKCELEFVSFYSSISYKLGFVFFRHATS